MSTNAGKQPAPADGQPSRPARAGRDLRDSTWGRALIIGALLLVALLVSRSCGAQRDRVSQSEAMTIALEHASFEPCRQQICRQIRFLQRGVPPVGYWAIVFSKSIDANGDPTQIESFLVNARSGAVSRP